MVYDGLYRVAVIGNTGVGKSASCNYVSGKQDGSNMSFPVSEKINSMTNKTTAQVEKWLGTGAEFVLVDTPGFGDTEGRDSVHIAEMVKELKKLQYMNVFLILFNSQNPRLDESLRAMIEIFTQIFGRTQFFDNVVLGFTRWDHSEKAERKRQRSGETRDSREREFNGYFRQKFGVTHSLPAVFIDAYPDPEDEAEFRANIQEVMKLKAITEKLLPFPLDNAEVVRGFMDQLNDKVKGESNRADAAQQEAKNERTRRQQDREHYQYQLNALRWELKEEKDKKHKKDKKEEEDEQEEEDETTEEETWDETREDYGTAFQQMQGALQDMLEREKRKKQKSWSFGLFGYTFTWE